MYKNDTVSVIMPCRNEGTHLQEIVKRIPKFVDEVIIVSNRSTDDTVKVAKRLGLTVYEDDRALKGIGYGFAHITGIEAATGDIIAGIDGDATYPIENLSSIIDDLQRRKLDFVSCNRYPLQRGTKIPLKLRFGVTILNIEARLLYGIKIKDILSGMWVFKKEVKPLLQLTMGDWNLSPQIKLNAALHSAIRFGEHSIAQHQRKGTTKQRYFKTGLSHLLWLIRNRLTTSVPLRRLHLRRNEYIFRFVAVGIAGFVFNSAVLLALIRYVGLGRIPSEAIAMILALQLTFVLHDKWTYSQQRTIGKTYALTFRRRYSSYLVSNSFGSLLTVVIFGMLSWLLPGLVALAAAAGVSMVWNFTMNKLLIWRGPKRQLLKEPSEL